jgi:TRAP transporter TAXI family solute receptor
MFQRYLRIGLAGLALTLATAVSAQNLSIATGGTGGVYYPMGGGMASVLSKHVPGMQATAEVTGGSVDNLKLVGSGQPYIGFTMSDAAQDAYKGEDKFKSKKVPVRTIAVLYPNRMHLVTVEGRNITKLSDLKGKHVSTGSPGSATEVMAFRILEAAGMDKDKDVLLGRRLADRSSDRFGQHAGHQDQDDRPCRSGAGHEQEIRQHLPVRHHTQDHV